VRSGQGKILRWWQWRAAGLGLNQPRPCRLRKLEQKKHAFPKGLLWVGSGHPGLGAKSASLTVPGFGSLVGTRNEKALTMLCRLCEAITPPLIQSTPHASPSASSALPPFSPPHHHPFSPVSFYTGRILLWHLSVGLNSTDCLSVPYIHRTGFVPASASLCRPYQLEQREGPTTVCSLFLKASSILVGFPRLLSLSC
jgi:hypothetical protein